MKKLLIAILALMFLIVVVSAIPANTTLHNTTLKAYLPVNASTVDLSGQSHTFTATGATIDTSVKKFGAGSAKFTSTGDNISSADSSDWYFPTKKVSLGGWYKIDATTDSIALVTQSQDGNDEWLLRYIGSTNQLHFFVYSNGTYVISAMCSYSPSSSFDYIVYTNDGTTQHIYVNGTDMPLTTNVNSGSFPDLSAPLYIGYHPSYGSKYQYKGGVDDWFVYKDEVIDGTVVPTREYITNPYASFSSDKISGTTPLSVQFTDATLGNTPTAYSYRLTNVTGNNTELAPFSTSASPSVVLTAGNWSINQTVTNAFGSSSAYAWVNVSGQSSSIMADFTASNTSGIQPLYVQFTDTSTTTDATIDLWAWDFGDGNTSVLQNPSHTYEVPGTHTANLTITNTSYSLVSTKLTTITVYKQPTADFSSFSTQGTAPFTTYFYDTSTNLNSGPYTYYTDFGDGNTSTEQNLYFTWNITGTYDVKHCITDSVTTACNNKTAYVTVGTATIAPVASFYGSPTTGNVPLTVFFTDVSSNTPTSWNWSFGDGIYSELQNPTHQYTRSGFKNVNLTATNSAGSNITVRLKFVRVN